MRPVIGQKRIMAELFGKPFADVPKTMLFLGQSGCGKSWIAAALAESLGVDEVSISAQDVSAETLADYRNCPIDKLYTIDLKGVQERYQNKFLKLIEEPSDHMRIILTSESEIGVLPTVLNRCLKVHFEPYSPDELKQFDWMCDCSDELVYSICKTPGQLTNLPATDLPALKSLCDAVIKSMKRANYANALSVALKVNTKDSYDKYDFDLFLGMLELSAFEEYKATGDDFAFKAYEALVRRREAYLNRSIIKESYVLGLLDELWRLSRSCS